MKEIVEELLTQAVREIKFVDGMPNYFTIGTEGVSGVVDACQSDLVNTQTVASIIMEFAYRQTAAKKLEDPTEFNENDIRSIVEKSEEEILAIPNRYAFIFTLPKGDWDISHRISEAIEIRKLDKADIEKWNGERASAQGSLEEVLDGINLGWQQYENGDNILSIDGVGLVLRSGQIIQVHGTPDVDPLFIFKILIAIYVVSGAVEYRKKIFPRKHTTAPYSFNVHKESGEYITSLMTSSEDRSMINNYRFKDTSLEFTYKIFDSLFGSLSKGKPHRKKMVDAQRRQRISLYWFFESLKAKDSHVKIVQLTTAFDALLPELDNKEVKAQMISTMITGDIVLPDTIHNRTLNLYRKRNDIVHGKVPISTVHDSDNELGSIAVWGTEILELLLKKTLKDFSQSFARYNATHPKGGKTK